MYPTIFCDLDGVMADIETHYRNVIGTHKGLGTLDWKAVRAYKNFYAELPMLPDAHKLWNFLRLLQHAGVANLKVLTGVPSSIPEAAANKRQWVARHLGAVEVITCRSSEKSYYCVPGDIIIDDWEKYKDLWLAKGGLWITHTSALDSINQLLDTKLFYSTGERYQ